jgi:hypothetical protein
MASEVCQAAEIRIRLNDDAAAASAVAAVGTATRHVSLPAEAAATVASVSGFAVDFDAIDEHEDSVRRGLAVVGRTGV